MCEMRAAFAVCGGKAATVCRLISSPVNRKRRLSYQMRAAEKTETGRRLIYSRHKGECKNGHGGQKSLGTRPPCVKSPPPSNLRDNLHTQDREHGCEVHPRDPRSRSARLPRSLCGFLYRAEAQRWHAEKHGELSQET
ncbi:hypothetical protein GN956_G25772 [Arapaima gigas]